MDGARDMAGIGIPFAAGVAAGAALFHSPPSFPPSVPGLLSVAIILPALYSLHRFDNGTGLKKIRLFFACLFLAAGVLCSMNSILTSGKESVEAMTEYFDPDTFSLGWNDTKPTGEWTRTGTFAGTSALVKYFPDGECWVFITNTSTYKGPGLAKFTTELFENLRSRYSSRFPLRNMFYAE